MKVAYLKFLNDVKLKGRINRRAIDVDFCRFYQVDMLLSPITITLDRDGGWVTDVNPPCDFKALSQQLEHDFNFKCKIINNEFIAAKCGCHIASNLPPQVISGKSASQIFPKDPIFHELQMMLHAADYTEGNALWIWGKGAEKVDDVVFEAPSEFEECHLLDATLKKYKLWPFF